MKGKNIKVLISRDERGTGQGISQIALQLLLQLLLAMPIASALASIEFTFVANKKIETVLAANVHNRVEVIGGEVMEVIGDESKYSLYWSSDWHNLFIKPKVEVGEDIELSLILIGGNAQDMRFTVGDVTAQAISINVMHNSAKPSSLSQNRYTTAANQPAMSDVLKQSILQMMRAMIADKQDQYYVISNKRLLAKREYLIIKQEKAYMHKGAGLSGAVLSLENRSRQPLSVSEQDLKHLFKDILAVSVLTSVIPARSKTQAFVVTKDSY